MYVGEFTDVPKKTLVAFCPCTVRPTQHMDEELKIGTFGRYILGKAHSVRDSRLLFSILPGDPTARFNMTDSDNNGWLYLAPNSDRLYPSFIVSPPQNSWLARVRVVPTCHVASSLVAVRNLEPQGMFYYNKPSDLETENCKVFVSAHSVALCVRFFIAGVPCVALQAFAADLSSSWFWPRSVPTFILAVGGRVRVVENNRDTTTDALRLYRHRENEQPVYWKVSNGQTTPISVHAQVGPVLEYATLQKAFWEAFRAPPTTAETGNEPPN